MSISRSCRKSLLSISVCIAISFAAATNRADESGSPGQGYSWLTEKPYLPPDFDQETFDNVWKNWPEPLRKKAEAASADERRKMAYQRYGLTPRHDGSKKPLQYVVDKDGNWIMNCFACHGGRVLGSTYPGAPNNRFALETLTAEIRLTKLQMKKPLTRMDVGSMVMPLGRTNGTTNAVMFGVALMAYRDSELNVHRHRLPPKMVHHDMDAPPWWHFHRKSHIYIDGFAQKGVRGLMQFMMVEQNGPEKFREWEEDFKDVFAFIQSVRPPKYPFAIDQELAKEGREVFHRNCADCHGTYGDSSDFPNEMVPIDVIGTDPVRLSALTKKHRAGYHESWFGYYGDQVTIDDPVGYIAPPLDGVWASAPYFHNGSVPTLWHVLHPSERPAIWKWASEELDRDRVGISVESFAALPKGLSQAERRQFFDTSQFGKSRQGHDFPETLSQSERTAVLEYLKTL